LNGMFLDIDIRMPTYRFTSSAATEGAILLLPDGAYRTDLRGRKVNFRQYAIQNALRWYQFANQHLDREIPNGSLILVTGCDMASSWGIASFSEVSADIEVELSFIPSCPDSRTYLWETNVSATVRTSPAHQPISVLNRVNSPALSIPNQSAAARDLIIPSASRNFDASYGTFNEVGGNQIYNITNHIALATIANRCKL